MSPTDFGGNPVPGWCITWKVSCCWQTEWLIFSPLSKLEWSNILFLIYFSRQDCWSCQTRSFSSNPWRSPRLTPQLHKPTPSTDVTRPRPPVFQSFRRSQGNKLTKEPVESKVQKNKQKQHRAKAHVFCRQPLKNSFQMFILSYGLHWSSLL